MTISTAIAMAVLLPLAASVLPALAGRLLRHRVGWLALVFPVVSTALLLWIAGAAGDEPRAVAAWSWVPSLGVELSFLVDGLSLFFGLIVSGIGCLIVFYAIFYLGDHYAHQGRFYSYLVLFMASMLGTVFADNLILLFVFWELTGLSSFLLIGFLHEHKASRIGARQALLVTATTGLAMLAGLILLGESAGTYRLSELLDRGGAGLAGLARATPALLLILVGGFGKSAQFPFFFWLPNAMAAPTPVSAYLHSATMVKLGVFLCARLFPLFADHPWWAPVLMSVCFFTMLLGGVLALLQTDLKAMLAFSTVSQLGLLCGVYGYAGLHGLRFDFLHILNHTIYKGGLFMMAGIIDHAAHTRDIRQLGGLFRRMPLVGLAALACCAAMAGVPGTAGFLSKETLLADLLDAARHGGPRDAAALGAVVLAAFLNVVFAARFFVRVFLGAPRSEGAREAHEPPMLFALAPLFLAASTLAFGLRPGALDALCEHWRVAGMQMAEPGHLGLWHGFTGELAISLSVLALGALAWAALERTRAFTLRVPRALQFGEGFESGLRALGRFARAITHALRTERPVAYLPVVIAAGLLFLGGAAWRGGLLEDVWPEIRQSRANGPVEPLRAFIAALICLSVSGVVLLRRWATQLISLSVAGFLTTFYFVMYRAPDLALTQILVEVVSLILILLLLGRFPKSAERGEQTQRPAGLRKAFNLALAAGTGLAMTGLVLVMTAHPHPAPLGRFFLAETVRLAQGTNAVNTVLVDFRGFDTLGEITVLVVATLGCLGLFMHYRRTPEEYRAGAASPGGFGEAHREDR